jgi:hypothetical protein
MVVNQHKWAVAVSTSLNAGLGMIFSQHECFFIEKKDQANVSFCTQLKLGG